MHYKTARNEAASWRCPVSGNPSVKAVGAWVENSGLEESVKTVGGKTVCGDDQLIYKDDTLCVSPHLLNFSLLKKTFDLIYLQFYVQL